jgi:hypothetical protein
MHGEHLDAALFRDPGEAGAFCWRRPGPAHLSVTGSHGPDRRFRILPALTSSRIGAEPASPFTFFTGQRN